MLKKQKTAGADLLTRTGREKALPLLSEKKITLL